MEAQVRSLVPPCSLEAGGPTKFDNAKASSMPKKTTISSQYSSVLTFSLEARFMD